MRNELGIGNVTLLRTAGSARVSHGAPGLQGSAHHAERLEREPRVSEPRVFPPRRSEQHGGAQ